MSDTTTVLIISSTKHGYLHTPGTGRIMLGTVSDGVLVCCKEVEVTFKVADTFMNGP